MKSIPTIIFAVFFSFGMSAQSSDVGSPTDIIPAFYSLGVLQSGTLNLADPSGLLTTDGASGADDVFYSFIAESQGVKVTVVPNNFDAIVEVWEGTSLLGNMNDAGSFGAEKLWQTNLVSGNQYVVRIYSITGSGSGTFSCKIETLPAIKVRDIYVPTYATYDAEDGIEGYQVNQFFTRDLLNPGYGYPVDINDQIQSTKYKFTKVSNGDVYYHTVNGTLQVIYWNDVEEGGIICPDESYEVAVQVELDGNYCGYSEAFEMILEPEPIATIDAGWGGQEYDLSGSLQMNALGPGQDITWYFETDNGDTALDPHQEDNESSSWVNLNSIDCIRYGRIYDVQMQASYCGITGPVSDPLTIYIIPYPKSKLNDIYCGETLLSNTAVQCEIITKAEQYVFQFAPIVSGDPNMIPIGPATMVYSSSVTLPLNGVDIEFGQTYRVGVKSFILNGDGCNDPQESDYGQFCEVVVELFGEPQDDLIDFSDDPEFGYNQQENENGTSKGDQPHHNQKVFSLDLSNENLEGTGILYVYDLDGRLVAQKNIYELQHAHALYYDLSSELAQGQYIFNLISGDKNYSKKIFIQ